MRILVTGGAGFIGSHLVDQLLSSGHDVICVDNFFTGSKENLKHHAGNPKLSIIDHDIINPLDLEKELGPGAKVDQIYNLACPASPVHYQHNPVRTIKANTIGVINMLGLARKHGARILQASTSEVYGDPDVHPQTEEYRGNVNPDGPRACYDEGKRVSETLCFDYHRMHGMEIKVVRIFNTYGPRMAFNDGRVVSNFVVQALKNEPITLYGDGLQTRSFCYVDDMVDGLIKMMNSPADITGPINLGNPINNELKSDLTILKLAELVKNYAGSTSQISHLPLPTDDPKQRWPDIKKAILILDWRPKVDLKEGLEKTIADFKQRLG